MQAGAGIDRASVYRDGDRACTTAMIERTRVLLTRRLAGEPMAYLLGMQGFRHLQLMVDPRVLIPRPETEELVELALDRLSGCRGALIRCLDLGTGSGAIALALADEGPSRLPPGARLVVTAVDRSDAALAVARDNAARCGLDVEWLHGDWFAPLAGRQFDLIVSNPPYVAPGDPHLTRGDLRFEPETALVAEGDGLAALDQLIHSAPAHLSPGGWLLLEHGHDQRDAVNTRLRAAGFTAVRSHHDLAGNPRHAEGQWR